MKSDLYKERYDFEWNHRTHLLEMTNVLIAVAAIVGSGLVFEVKTFEYTSWLFCWFLVLSIGSALALAASVYFIARSIVGYGYSHIATPKQLEEYESQLGQWCSENGLPPDDVAIHLQRFIDERIAEAVEVNVANNRRKSAYAQKSIISVCLSFGFLFFATVPYLAATIEYPGGIWKNEPANPASIIKESKTVAEDEQKPTQQPTQSQPEAKPQTPKPIGPQNIIIKEDREVGNEIQKQHSTSD